VRARVGHAWLAALLAGTIAVAYPPGVAHAFAVSKWEAGTCRESSCTDAGSRAAFYTQAAGHPDFGITDFAFDYRQVGPLDRQPEGKVKDVRVDLPPGLSINPEATPICTEQQLDNFHCPRESQVGEDEATGTATVLELLHLASATVTEHFPVYNMARLPGEPARFGVEINSETLRLLALAGRDLRGHIYLEGGISWHPEPPRPSGEDSGVVSGDYHEFFEIHEVPQEPELIESKLIFWGVPQEHQENPVHSAAAFITLPSICSSKPITQLHVDSYEDPGHFLAYENETPVPATGCDQLAFSPSLSLTPETTQSDQPDGVSADLHVPQATLQPSIPNSPDVQGAQVTLPEGISLDPSAAGGLQACTGRQFSEGTCPSASRVGTVSVDAPGIPNGSLTGGVYVGSPEPGQGPESGGEYRMFLIAEAPSYGVGMRLEGRVRANAQTGQLTASFTDGPQVPFEDIELHFNGGPRAPLANPLACGPIAPAAAITPYGGEPAAAAATSEFVVDGDGSGGPCAAPLPFALVQSIAPQSPAQAGAYSPFTFNLTRGDGQQYLSQITTTLPAGLIAAIPSIALCDEPEASAGDCPAQSEIGTVAVAAGAGSEPYPFTGRAYLTGPYNGAPYGLSIVVPAKAGPYDFGEVVTRAGVSVGLYSGRVTVTSAPLPAIVGGVPLRLKGLTVAVNRPNFLFNPTSCVPLATESLLTSTFGASQSVSSPFQVGGCGSLAFTPSLTASSNAKIASRFGGASLAVKVTQPAHQANIRELQLQLPKQLVARDSTLQSACLVASFEPNSPPTPPPGTCKSTAKVGEVTVATPVLAGVLKGPAYLVSHGAGAFPDLDLVLRGDGVEVVLVGHTHIAHSSVTTATFENLPDVPISSVTVRLPVGPSSALSANGSLCNAALLAPTTIIAQSGARIQRNTRVSVSGCRRHARKRAAHRRRRRCSRRCRAARRRR
jgi:hypothetical protein